jgi:Zn-dependent membrane protease YugP
MFFDPMYLIISLPALLLAFYAQWKVQWAYRKYSAEPNMRGLSGIQIARMLLDDAGLTAVNIEGVPGDLTDHYDPRSKTLRLSGGVANSRSVASLGIVAHEVGHAQQDSQGYMPMRLRSGLVPISSLGSWAGPIIFILGFLLRSPAIAQIGLVVFAAAVVFTAVTLPVELNASKRALAMLQSASLVDNRELGGARTVLNAAALTYWAALAQAISTFLYYSMLLSGMRRRD